MNHRSPLTAFFLTFIPGMGHLYLGKRLRGVFYAVLVLIIIFLGFAVAISSYDPAEPLLVAVFFSFLVWGISMIDMIITLLRAQGRPTCNEVLSELATEEVSHQAAGSAESDRFYTLLLSIIPGLGHFHMGLMNRGLAFLIAFFGLGTMIIFTSVVTQQKGFIAFIGVLPIIWIYNMFDAVQQLSRKQRGEEALDRTFLEDFTHGRGEKKSKAITTILSIFPGAGHMYLGLQKRGLQFMAGFLLAIYILDVLRLSLFLFLIPIIWFYSFFDALQQASKSEYEELEDVPLVQYFVNHQRWFGIALLLLGLYYLLDHVMIPTVIRELGEMLQVNLTLYYRQYFQTTVLCILLIGGGIKLLAGSKRKKEED